MKLPVGSAYCLLATADILVDEIPIPHAADKNHCMQIKPDISLEDHGVEISVPISTIERIDPHHIEIKSIGGDDYHKEAERIMREFENYTDYFSQALGEMTEEHKRLLETHKQMLDSLDKEAKGRFASALIEAGILK